MDRLAQFYPSARNIILTCLAAGWLTACGGSDTIDLTSSKNVRDAIDAATGPLEDLNIKKREIPEPLKVAARDPYALPDAKKCEDIRAQIAVFDEILGADMQAKEVEVASADGSFLGLSMSISDVKIPDSEQLQDQATSYAHDSVMGFIRDQTNIIPFRSVVRTVTGAKRYQKKVAEAYEAGKLRRAYLKGYAQQKFGRKCLTAPIKPAVQKEEASDEADTIPAEEAQKHASL